MNTIIVKIEKEKKQLLKKEDSIKVIETKNEDESNKNDESNENNQDKKTSEFSEDIKNKTDSINRHLKEYNSDQNINLNVNKIGENKTIIISDNNEKIETANKEEKKNSTNIDFEIKEFEKRHSIDFDMKDQKEVITNLFVNFII